MKKIISITLLTIILITSFSFLTFAEENTNTTEENYIVIKLTEESDEDGIKKAIVKSNILDDNYAINYRLDNDGVVVGRKESNDLIFLLGIASEISGEKYELHIRNYGMHNNNHYKSDASKILGYHTYEIILKSYKDDVLQKNIEFFTSGIKNGDKLFGTYNSLPHIYLLPNYEYYLPLRYIFEELDFNVHWDNENKAIFITK